MPTLISNLPPDPPPHRRRPPPHQHPHLIATDHSSNDDDDDCNCEELKVRVARCRRCFHKIHPSYLDEDYEEQQDGGGGGCDCEVAKAHASRCKRCFKKGLSAWMFYLLLVGLAAFILVT